MRHFIKFLFSISLCVFHKIIFKLFLMKNLFILTIRKFHDSLLEKQRRLFTNKSRRDGLVIEKICPSDVHVTYPVLFY